MKKILSTLLCSTAFLSSFCLFGCSKKEPENPARIVSITQSGKVENVTTYTITYSDGSTYTFEVKDGEDGSVTVDDLYNKYSEIYGDITYDEFLKIYLKSNEDQLVYSTHKTLASSAKVYTEFYETRSSGSIGGLFTGLQQVKTNSLYQGSAVIYQITDTDVYFITNYHVIYSSYANSDNNGYISSNINIYLYGSEGGATQSGTKKVNGTEYMNYKYDEYAIPASYVGGSVTYDLAVVKASKEDVFNVNPYVLPVEFASSYSVGETAIAIGNSEGEGISVTQGVVSVDSEYINLEIDKKRSYRSIRIDTAIYSGNSGGGLFNSRGELIGITNAGDETDQNINFAIPLEIVKCGVANIVRNSVDKQMKVATLGLTIEEKNTHYEFNSKTGKGSTISTVQISSVKSKSIAEKMNLSSNDILNSLIINGEEYKINRSYDIGSLLLLIKEGDTISFKINSNNEEKESSSYTLSRSDLSLID